TQITGQLPFTSIAAGGSHALALASGNVYTWGHNEFGQLGFGDTTDRLSPKDNSFTEARAIAAGRSHSMYVDSVGQGGFCGSNSSGQLALGDYYDRYSWIVSGGSIVDISCGRFHTVCCTASGTLFTVGDNSYGQLGLGDGTNRNTWTPSVPFVTS